MYSVLSYHDQSVGSQLKSNHIFPWLDLRLTGDRGRRIFYYNFPWCLRNSLQQMLRFKLQLFPATACSNSSLIAAIQLKLPSGQRPSAPVRSPVYNKVYHNLMNQVWSSQAPEYTTELCNLLLNPMEDSPHKVLKRELMKLIAMTAAAMPNHGRAW